MADYIRIYDARCVSCLKCDNIEEMGVDDPRSNFGQFEYDYGAKHYTCLKCGTQCVQEAEIKEFRDWE